MGSPISTVVAELTMQKIEHQLLSQTHCTVHIWKRYVDDCIAILPNNQVTLFSNYINSIDGNIQFTCEEEVNQQLPYLDLLLHRQQNGSIKFSVFRKETHTGKYLSYNSYHHESHKRSVITSLVSRAFKLCSSDMLEEELDYIRNGLLRNGYPNYMIS